MPHPSTYDSFVLNEIPNLTAQSVLDCGCGRGIWGYLTRVNRSGNEAYMVGLDCAHEYLKFNKKHKVKIRIIGARYSCAFEVERN